MGGIQLGALGRCIYAMRVSETMSFEEYWASPEYRCKRPVRSRSLKVMVGDTIYHRDGRAQWVQENSHHSRPDGTPDAANMKTD